MAREGSLEAPTRHPLDWLNPEFYSEEACLTEMERIFDICHGCRRCVSLCGSLPTLFYLVDATEDGEVHVIKMIHNGENHGGSGNMEIIIEENDHDLHENGNKKVIRKKVNKRKKR